MTREWVEVKLRHLAAHHLFTIHVSFTIKMKNMWLESLQWSRYSSVCFIHHHECVSRTEQMNPQHSELDPIGKIQFPTSTVTKLEYGEDLLECLWEEEALLHVIMADRHGVNVTDPRKARLHSAVLLQGLTDMRQMAGLNVYMQLQKKHFFFFSGQKNNPFVAVAGLILQTERIILLSLVHVYLLFHLISSQSGLFTSAVWQDQILYKLHRGNHKAYR